MPEITKKEQLDWLDMQRDAVNTEIAYAAPDEKKQYHKSLQIINAIAEFIKGDGEMTAVEFLEARRDICATHMGKSSFRTCAGCPLFETGFTCGNLADRYPRRAVEIVKNWKEGHPHEN